MKYWKYCTFSLGILLSGCATSTVFTSYPTKMAPNLHDINQGQYQQCIASLNRDQKSQDYELYAAELGRTQQLAQNYSASTATFIPLMSKTEADQLAAKIRVSTALANTGSMATNDNAIPYQLSGYEITFLYQYQTLNFIAQNNISDALVTARKANNLQTYLAEDYQTQLAKAQNSAKTNHLDITKTMNNQTAQLQSTLAASASVKSAFANAMSYYLSGMLFLATNDLNSASVAFKQAVSIMPNNTFLQNILLTTLQRQGAPKVDISNYQTAFDLKTLPAIPTNKAFVTVMYDQNFVSQRISIKLPVFLSNPNQVQSLAFPAYPTPPAITPLNVSLTVNNKITPLSDTQLMVDTNALAAKDLMGQYPVIFVREALRFLTKSAAVAAAQNNNNNNNNNNANNLASALLQIYSIYSDKADLRSWLTLPQDVQIAQYALAPGTQEFQFSNQHLNTKVSVNLEKNHYYLIWVSQHGQTMQASLFNL